MGHLDKLLSTELPIIIFEIELDSFVMMLWYFCSYLLFGCFPDKCFRFRMTHILPKEDHTVETDYPQLRRVFSH